MKKSVRAVMMLLLLGSAAACTEISGTHPDVVEARLLAPDGTELTPVVAVPFGDFGELEARFYDASGNEVALRYPEHATRLRTDPPGILHIQTIPDEPFSRLVSIAAPCLDEPRMVWIGYGHWGTGDEREFGPFEVRALNEVLTMHLFGPAGEQLTPEVELSAGHPLRVDARFFGCEGQPVMDLPEAQSILIYWTDPEMVDVQPVDGERFAREITALKPVGTTGQMSIAYGTADRPEMVVFGPYTVTVVE